MDIFVAEFNIAIMVATITLAVMAGFVKGVCGFAFPMIMMSGLGAMFEPAQAVSYLIFPLLVVNVAQLLQFGLKAAKEAAGKYVRITLTLCVFLFIASPLVLILPKTSLYLLLGIPITLIAVLQLSGWRLQIAASHRVHVEYGTGLIAGICGGFAGVWAPLVVTYLLALDITKREYILSQGVIYSAGSIILIVAHLNTAVLNAQTMPVSLGLIIPSVAGLYLGSALREKLDNARFRQSVHVVLAVAGLNLVMQGFS